MCCVILEQSLNLLVCAVINRGQPPPVLYGRVSSVAQEELDSGDVINNDSIVEWCEAGIADKVVDSRVEFMIPHCRHCDRGQRVRRHREREKLKL